MSRDLLLTFDVGTTTIKTTLWDARLRPLRLHRAEYPLVVRGSRIEVAPSTYIAAVVAGARQVLGKTAAESVAAVAFTTQGETLIPTSPDGRARGNAIVWLDDRAGAEAAALRAQLGTDPFYAATGLPQLDGTVPLAKALHLRGEFGADWGSTRLLLLEDYLVTWLTGEFAANRALHTSTGWLNLASGDYDDAALAAAGLDRGQLPCLLDSGNPVGAVRPGPASELGLRPGTLVVSGAMDQAAAALGSGVDTHGRVAVSFGTALVVTAGSTSPLVDLDLRPTVYLSAVAGSYLTVLIAPTAGALLRWLRDLFDDGAGDLDYAALDQLAGAVQPGCDGLLALPFFEGGYGREANARGTLLGLSLATGRGELARSLLEGTSYALRGLLDTLAALGVPVTELRSSGGGSRSPLWQSIAADICGVQLTRLPFAEAASAGAALLAGWGSGVVAPGSDPRSLGDVMPVYPQQVRAYAEGHQRYRRALDLLHPLWTTSQQGGSV